MSKVLSLLRHIEEQAEKGHYLNALDACAELNLVLLGMMGEALKKGAALASGGEREGNS